MAAQSISCVAEIAQGIWGSSPSTSPHHRFIGTHQDYDKIDVLRGLNISITTTAKTDEECRALLTSFKFPFKT